ncbi:MAG: PEGA domain-containing protein [Lentisphaeria bacterium]|nr:PEGA domain-containing protein [Lentisphaeria bacterium]
MKKLLNALLTALLLTAAGCNRDNAPPRGILEISGPPGLRIEIGGKVFTGNPQRLRLDAKRYLVKCSAPGYRVRYCFVNVRNNDRLSLRAELKPENSAVLIESEPAGAQVLFGGAPRGTTPAVIADLPAGEHKAVLRLPGYADREVKWKISDGRPALVRGSLELNTGTLLLESVPEGAKILIDGVEAGATPARVERAEGRYRIRFESPGCVPAECSVTLGRGKVETVRRQLAMKPARLTVESLPEGAEVLLDGEKRGITPCSIENLTAGRHLVRVSLALHEPAERELKLVAGSSETIRFNLESGVGSCRIVVRPAGVALTLNGAPIGVVKAPPGDPKEVVPLVLRDLTPGKYRLGMSHPNA